MSHKNFLAGEENFNHLEKAQHAAIKFVTENFQRPEQLENLENIRRKITVQKSTVDEQLKTLLRYYANGTRNSLKELHQSTTDVQEIGKSLLFINEKCKQFTELEPQLREVKSISNNMCYLNKAILLLNQLFQVPGDVAKTKSAISNGEWLLAHKNIRELENIRDTLCLEHLRSTHSLGRLNTSSDDWPLSKYFSELISLRRALCDKIFEIFDNLNKVAVESPTKLVNALRIVEREEVVDDFWLSKKVELKGFMPIFRPLSYKKKTFDSIEKGIYSKIRQIRENTDPEEKEYINLIFTQIRNTVLSDLKLIKQNTSKCFPPQYNILLFYATTYHKAIKSEIETIINESTEEMKYRYAVPLLVWARDYTGETLFGDKDLGEEVCSTISSMEPLLSFENKELLYNCYISSLYKMMADYTTNAVTIESKDWRSEKTKPDCYNKLYQTMLPTLLTQTVISSLQSAGSFGFDIKLKVFKLFLSAIENCIEKYIQAYEEYSSENFNAAKIIANYSNMSNLPTNVIIPQSEHGYTFFIEYTMAISNNCFQLLDGVKMLCSQIITDAKKFKSSLNDSCADDFILGEESNNRIATINNSILNLSNITCSAIVKDFSSSMSEAFNSLFTEEWKNNPEGWSDGFYSALQDFSDVIIALNENGRLLVWKGIDHWIATQYIQILCKMKLKIRDKSEKIFLGEQMFKDVKRLMEFFKNARQLEHDDDVECYAASICVDMFKCRDISFVRFDLTKLCSLYADFTEEHALCLLSTRGDMSKDAIKNQIHEIDFNDKSTPNKKSGIFKEINTNKGDIFSVFNKL